MSKEKRLGRGLAALLGDEAEPVSMSQLAATKAPLPRLHEPTSPSPYVDEDEAADSAVVEPSDGRPAQEVDRAPHSEADTATDGDLLLLSVYEIDDNPFQPRRDFGESEIASLAESLKAHDMLQPILVRRIGQRWQLISGERRLRAAIQAGWSQVPARVRQADDRLVAELAIVENLQRKDLNAIEKALSFRRYLDQHQCTQDELGQRLKIDRSTIANLMRLLELPAQLQTEIQTGEISAGHARALLPLGDEPIQLEFGRRIKSEGWSVRETERQVQDRIAVEDGDITSDSSRGPKRRKATRSSHIASLEQQFRILLGTKVDIKQSARGRGQIVIHFKNNDEFERLQGLIGDSSDDSRQRFAG